LTSAKKYDFKRYLSRCGARTYAAGGGRRAKSLIVSDLRHWNGAMTKLLFFYKSIIIYLCRFVNQLIDLHDYLVFRYL